MKTKTFTCPFCAEIQEENCEYVDVGVGLIQCTPNYCYGCDAVELSSYSSEKDSSEFEFKEGWIRKKDETVR